MRPETNRTDQHLPEADPEGGNTLRAALLGEGVVAGPRQLAVGEGLLAGFGERDERGGVDAKLAAPATDDEPLYPASYAGRLEEQ